MAAQRLTLFAPDEGPLAAATRGRAGLVIETFRSGASVIVSCSGKTGDATTLAHALGLASASSFSAGPAGALTAIVGRHERVEALEKAVKSAGAALLPPLLWSGGSVQVAAFCPDAASARRLMAMLPGARVVEKRPVRASAGKRAAGGFLDRLTPRQAAALSAAIAAGYYESPRAVTTAEVALSLGVTRSTFEEQLRKAEAIVVKAMAPLVRLHAPARDAGTGADVVAVYEKYSRELGKYVHLTLTGAAVSGVTVHDRPDPAAGHEHPYLARLLSHLATGTDDLRDIPVDLPVGSFERRVLKALRNIPPGKVLTYGELARRLGHPQAARAVGNALARNPVPLIVPCHRVVPASGGVGNYSMGGPDVKRTLLAVEGARVDGEPDAAEKKPRKRGRGHKGRA